jgi:hypothetical protein
MMHGTTNVKYIHEIKSSIAMAKTPFNKKSLFTIKFDLKFKEGTSKVLHLKYSLE